MVSVPIASQGPRQHAALGGKWRSREGRSQHAVRASRTAGVDLAADRRNAGFKPTNSIFRRRHGGPLLAMVRVMSAPVLVACFRVVTSFVGARATSRGQGHGALLRGGGGVGGPLSGSALTCRWASVPARRHGRRRERPVSPGLGGADLGRRRHLLDVVDPRQAPAVAWHAAIVATAFVIASSASARAQKRTDVATLLNGDRITGEILSAEPRTARV